MTLGELILESTSQNVIESILAERAKTGAGAKRKKKQRAKKAEKSLVSSKSGTPAKAKTYDITLRARSGNRSKTSNISISKPSHIDTNRKHQKSGAAKHVGRKRLIAAVATMAAKRSGINVSKDQVRVYLSELDKRMRENREPYWLKKIVMKAKSLGFDPYGYIDQSQGASSGVSNYGQPEYKGRAYFFVALSNNIAKDLKDGFTKPQQRSYVKRGK